MGRPEVALVKVPYVAPPLLLLAGGAVDVFAPRPHYGLPLLACTPLVAGTVYSFRASALLALLACGMAGGVAQYAGREKYAQATDVLVVLVISLVGLWIKWLVDRQGRDLALALTVAEAAQRAVLPAPPPAVGPIAVADRYVAAQVGAAIGGDLYALQETPFGIRALIGDVRGKGLPAVSAVSVAVGAFREAAEHAPSLHDLADRLDRALDREGMRRQETLDDIEGFVTALLVQIPPSGETITVLNRGHPPPYLVSGDQVSCLEPANPELPLSTGLGPAHGDPVEENFAFAARDSLILVTDGVTEARNDRGVFFDVVEALSGVGPRRPDQLADRLLEAVTKWTGGQRQDDMAVLVLTRVSEQREK
ncbi:MULTISPECIES: PP2C family protein-serine/threonine phosphatase [unclassified Streptomyces]|uniref:PP2C family protein-serine/threonine phosphatase n=1 Tax=unclassified Streptomyces TaxID=2593676 RepID=UPI002DDBA81C|nr:MULTISPECIES: PP2C family protein-serine/threonine phosphatase [unclassified Streptomyces]WSB75342.1 serine/threonine-protein phosphatase [Streptomyces sp. NBC_01775]WSS16375.1 serine/threonine-protein phosphatase [Streptomyces sp. NBC_01186]WSS45193.1 serine/threonine-protein phosphatase [Streptomyces sp. NBC_01187]